ncbi:MAG: toprim domain-containing protein [Oligosphaeraceae bacterium]
MPRPKDIDPTPGQSSDPQEGPMLPLEEDAHLPTPQEAHYDEDTIRSLDPLQHMRQRPSMYIGAPGNGDHNDDGLYVLFKEVLDNSIDEFLMGYGRRVTVTLAPDRTITVRDFGRGIPLGKLRDCVSRINTGGKYDEEDEKGRPVAFSASIGMNGVGLKAVNFLSHTFVATSYRNGQMARVTSQEGKLVQEEKGETSEPNGTCISFLPSEQIFGAFHFEQKFLERRLQHYAWLNIGLTLELNGKRFFSRRGLLDLLESKMESDALYEPIHYRSRTLEFAFCHTNSANENYYSFVNTQFTNDGGTHLTAFREGVVKGINELAPKDKTYDPEDVRAGLFGAVSIRLKNPKFEAQTKHKLCNYEIRSEVVNEVKTALVQFLYKHPEVKGAIFEKLAKNESIRKEIQNIRKGAKELAAKSSLKIQKLRDCKFHLNETDSRRKPEEKALCQNSMLFLTEGDSAAGSVVQNRDAQYQAVFALKGKVFNCCNATREVLYRHEELYCVMRALGTEDSMENLRYAKVVIATDADPDGYHIRNLLITFFLRFFPQLLSAEHLFILETPLFRVRSKSHPPVYCYSEEERERAVKAMGKEAEITRFKGLGEISPKEFGQFIRGNDIRLQLVSLENARKLDGFVNFLMGANPPSRKEYILGRLQ